MIDYLTLANQVISGKQIGKDEALSLINTSDEDTFLLLAAANKMRQHFKNNKVKLCAIINAKSGKCPENCIFCGQSAHYNTKVMEYPLVDQKEILNSAKNAKKDMKATCFSIVTSGKGSKNLDFDSICSSVSALENEVDINRCTSIGTLTLEDAKKLKKAGLKKYHHNLETAESFFPNICTTHKFSDRIETIKNAKEAGLDVCSGGIFGVGESLEQRIELAFTLKELDVTSVPINILNPVKGTPAAENYKQMTPLEVLRLIATYRFVLPEKDIGIFGGRELALRDLQPLLFIAGANVILVGNYLTTAGQSPEKDTQMIKDLGLEIEG